MRAHISTTLIPVSCDCCNNSFNSNFEQSFRIGFQRADGVFGSLIVRQSRQNDPHSSLYDYDLPEHVMLVSDWLGELGVAKFVAHHHDDGDNKPTSMIINGRGRVPKSRSELTSNETMPLSVFDVEQVWLSIFRTFNICSSFPHIFLIFICPLY
jgi:hypothetical protein